MTSYIDGKRVIKHKDEFNITGRGLVRTLSMKENGLTFNKKNLKINELSVGDKVYFQDDVEKYEIKGIECSKILLDPPTLDDSIGLLVMAKC